jgi:adenylosuccinate lyase
VQLNPLTAISPVDGRYFETVKPLAPYFSEFGLMRYRVQVEIEYFIAMSATVPELEDFPVHTLQELRRLYKNFNEAHAAEIKLIEKTTNHDVKAVEYYIKKEFERLRLEPFREFIHFGLTSQDINNTAIPLLLKEFIEREYMVTIEMLLSKLNVLAIEWKDIPMLAFTHGQPASPTRLGKEIMVFAARLEKQLNQLKSVPHSGKFGGATGNFNAHAVAYPTIDWNKFGDEFCHHLGLVRSYPTTQIEHYDNHHHD